MTSPDQLLDALDPEQREVASALHGPVRVLAGAGTGKTRAITHRIAYGVATGVFKPSEVLAVTFTTRAAGEMRQRLRSLGADGVQARTFHSAALRQARFFWPKVYGGDLPELTESKLPLVAGAARRNRLNAEAGTLRDLAGEIEWAKVSNVRPDDYVGVAAARGRQLAGVDAATVAHVFSSYEELKREAGRMDMEDVLLCCAALLAEDERVAAQVRSQYRNFVVDEFQDVSPIQAALLDLWLGGRDSICVVGDPSQTIYSFAGADAGFLLDFPKKFPGTTSIELVRNYRSTPEIVTAANKLMQATGGVRLISQQQAGPQVQYVECTDEVAEADQVAEQIAALVQAGRSPGDMAVLLRINAQSEAYEEALAARNVSYVVRGAERFFQRAEVRQAVALLRGAARAAADGALVEDVRAILSGMGWAEQAPTGRGAARDRWESLQALITQAEAFAAGGGDLAGFVEDLDRRAAEQHAPVADGVTVATLHAAKGLEWDVVFLVGVQEGTLPITYAETDAAIDEERRLLYVGVTRARERLSISWSKARSPGGRAYRQPSRFLDGLRPITETTSGRRARVSKSCRTCGQLLTSVIERKRGRHDGCDAPYDEELFERLRAWRRQTADEMSVPAFVIFTDVTLQEIAEVKPADKRSLLAVTGVGPSKWESYGDQVLAVVAGDLS